MSQINLPKPDKFYLLFAVAMISAAVFVVFVFKAIFDSVRMSADIGEQFSEVELKIDREKLDNALKYASEKKVLELDMK